ncbi:PepSY-associated TM helix domain-containing protein [Ferrimonas balearica]|uniref:PepSY-associated TM helix domain-containing protein n=1 Tax=Ferrimonas balearica TaxID=44012 RepID=UPI001C976463|nr:PepSY-associated TM helix domain-containing protein [Ferrimonas balearica]MBY6105958.1 PepSY-associated TM helix domain-containing protein [Ferrimonas balearica]
MLRSKPVQQWSRTLHIYVSMSLLLVVLFFAITGVTLNRPDWFVGEPQRIESELPLSPALLTADALRHPSGEQALLEVLRQQGGLKGLASPLQIYTEVEDGELVEGEVTLDFKGPGYDASVYIDLLEPVAEVSVTDYGTVAWLNDLHKGRNTGAAWHWFIDLSAVLMVLFVLTGVVLLVPKKRTLRTAMAWTLVGSGATVSLYLMSL